MAKKIDDFSMSFSKNKKDSESKNKNNFFFGLRLFFLRLRLFFSTFFLFPYFPYWGYCAQAQLLLWLYASVCCRVILYQLKIMSFSPKAYLPKAKYIFWYGGARAFSLTFLGEKPMFSKIFKKFYSKSETTPKFWKKIKNYFNMVPKTS